MKETVLRIRRKQNSIYYGRQRSGVGVVVVAFVVGYGEGFNCCEVSNSHRSLLSFLLGTVGHCFSCQSTTLI